MTGRVVLDNTLHSRGFAREIDGRYYGPDWLRPERNSRRIGTSPSRRPRRTFHAWDNPRPATTSAVRTEDPYGPIVWLAALAVCVAAFAGLAWALPTLLGAAIEAGDWLGITARQR